MNVQDLASLSDQIWQITGLRVRETVPDWVFQEADEVVMVDVTPRALLHRLERGVIYPPERAKMESARLFQEPTLVALRELAIRQTAQALEARAMAKKQSSRNARGENPGSCDGRCFYGDVAAARASRGGFPSCSLRSGVCLPRA